MLIISPAQCRAARALLNWSQPVLAEECNLHVQTISNFEKNSKIPSKRTLEIIYATYLKNNIVFYENDGVQRRTNNVIHIRDTRQPLISFGTFTRLRKPLIQIYAFRM